MQSWETTCSCHCAPLPYTTTSVYTHPRQSWALQVRELLKTFSHIPSPQDFRCLPHRHWGYVSHKDLSLTFIFFFSNHPLTSLPFLSAFAFCSLSLHNWNHICILNYSPCFFFTLLRKTSQGNCLPLKLQVLPSLNLPTFPIANSLHARN